jgi:hypothetical protein
VTRRGVYRGVYSSLLDDPDYQQLSADARLVLLTLRLCAQAGAAAIFRAYPAVLSEQTGLEVDEVDKALKELACSPRSDRPWIYRESGVVWVRNALRYDPNLRLADDKHRKSVERALSGLPRLGIVAKFCAYYEIASPFDDPGETLGTPSEDLSPPSTESETEYRVPNTENRDRFRPSGSSTPNGNHPHGSDESGSKIREVEL